MRQFWTVSDLHAEGLTRREIRRLVELGRLREVRKGVLAAPTAAGQRVRAVRAGGVATGSTGARELGLWTPPDVPGGAPPAFPRDPSTDVLRVAVRRTTTRFHDPDVPGAAFGLRRDVVLHRTDPAAVDRGLPAGVAPVHDVVVHAFQGLPAERALGVLDSALHHRHLRPTELPAIAARLPADLRPVVLAGDGEADSGTESIARFRLRLAGLKVVVHPVLAGIGEVDLLVEGRVVVECDSREFHADDDAYRRDRRRDAVAHRGRYRVVRLMWWTVLFDWPTAEAAVLGALAA